MWLKLSGFFSHGPHPIAAFDKKEPEPKSASVLLDNADVLFFFANEKGQTQVEFKEREKASDPMLHRRPLILDQTVEQIYEMIKAGGG
jgi:hypothetical protein